MRFDTYSEMSGGRLALSADGIPMQISAYASDDGIPCRSLALVASSTNAADIFVGKASTITSATGWPLQAGDSVTIDIDNTNKISACGTNGDIVHYMVLIQ